MKVWSHFSNTVVNLLGWVDDLVGMNGLRHTTNSTLAIVNESLDQSLVMNRVEAKKELADFLIQHNATVDEAGNVEFIEPKKVTKK